MLSDKLVHADLHNIVKTIMFINVIDELLLLESLCLYLMIYDIIEIT
jgi:hypothetical protein